MFEYTKDNHLVYGYNNEPWQEWRRPGDQFFWTVGRPEKPGLDWASACTLAARTIAGSVGRYKLALAFSGGMDSQFMLLSFIKAGVDFEVFHLSTGHPFETPAALAFCAKLGIECNVIELDPTRFFEEGYKEFDDLPGSHGAYQLHLYLIEYLIDCGYLTVVGETLLTRAHGAQWCLAQGAPFMAPSRYLRRNGWPGFPTFFSYLPEQLSAYVSSSYMKQVMIWGFDDFEIDNGQYRSLNRRNVDQHNHKTKYWLMLGFYREMEYARKMMGHEHLAGEPYYEEHLSFGHLVQRNPKFGKQYHRHFQYNDPKALSRYFAGEAPFGESLVPMKCTYWFPNYPY